MRILFQILALTYFFCTSYGQSNENEYEKKLYMFSSEVIDSTGLLVERIGYKDSNKNIVIQPSFRYGDHSFTQYARVLLDGKMGLINRKGEYVIPLEYDDLSYASEGYIRARLYDVWGFINIDTQRKSSFKYKGLSPFENGLAYALTFENRVYVIDTNENIVNELFYDIPKSNSYPATRVLDILTNCDRVSDLKVFVESFTEKSIPYISLSCGFDKESVYKSLANTPCGIVYQSSGDYGGGTNTLKIPSVTLQDVIRFVLNKFNHLGDVKIIDDKLRFAWGLSELVISKNENGIVEVSHYWESP